MNLKRYTGLILILLVVLGMRGGQVSGAVLPYAVTINITDGLSPATVALAVPGVVTWNNTSTSNRLIVANNGDFSSGVLAPGASYVHTITFPGIYTYAETVSGSTGSIQAVQQRWHVYIPLLNK